MKHSISAITAALAVIARGRNLSVEATVSVFREIMGGRCNDAQIGGLLLGLAQKGETVDEISGAVMALREAVIPVDCARESTIIDTCGTGGSGTPRFNVSTTVAIVLAACGVRVAKHGNRGASSPSGSADVLEALGINICASPKTVAQCIDQIGVGFLFAHTLHPAMKHAAAVRRALAIPTIFNLLGPLTNPARTLRQVVGVYDPKRCETLARVLGNLGSERVFVVHGFRSGVIARPDSPAGIDDLSPEGDSLVVEFKQGNVLFHRLCPEDAGLSRSPLHAIAGRAPAFNAKAFRRLLEGEQSRELSGYRQAVLYSGALALLAASDAPIEHLPDFATMVGSAIDDGRAAKVLERLIVLSHAA